jgi:hypothetical protein
MPPLGRAARISARISGRQESQLVPALVIAPIASSEVAPPTTAASTAPHDTPKQAQISPPRSLATPPASSARRQILRALEPGKQAVTCVAQARFDDLGPRRVVVDQQYRQRLRHRAAGATSMPPQLRR